MRELHDKDRASPVNRQYLNPTRWHQPQDLYPQIEKAFLREVGKAEELAKLIEPGNMEMPDAMESIFQSALDYGRHGAMIDDQDLGMITNLPGVFIFGLVIVYHYVTADPKYEAS